MWAASDMARVDVARRVAFRDMMAVRSQLRDPPSWTAIFVKAYAIVAAEVPELRRVYMKYPWPHFYEYSDSMASVLQERQILDDIGVLPLRIRTPDQCPLGELNESIRHAVNAPLEGAGFNRRLVAIARLPLPIRRAFWWIGLNVPRLRKQIGTYGVSSAARWKSVLGTSRTVLPCLLSYGPADADGVVDVRLSFDHRIFDGALAGRVLSRLDQVLNSEIVGEMRELAAAEAAAVGGQPAAKAGKPAR
jgi:hypothetical protein